MDFIFEDNPQFDPPLVARKKVKLTASEQEVAQENLALAILDKSASKVQEALDEGALVRTSSKCRGERVSSFALKHFDPSVMDTLMSAKIGVGFIDTLAADALKKFSLDAFLWLVNYTDKENIKLYWSRLASISVEDDHRKAATVLPLAAQRDQSSVRSTSGYEYQKINSYNIANILSNCIKKNDLDAFKTIWECVPDLKNPKTTDARTNRVTESFVNNFITGWVKRLTYKDMASLSKIVDHVPEFKKCFDAEFPIDVIVSHHALLSNPSGQVVGNYHGHFEHEKLSCKNILEYLVVSGAPVVSELARLSDGRKKMGEIFSKNPVALYGCVRSANAPTIEALSLALKEFFTTWHDPQGNNFAHVYLLHNQTRSAAELCYKNCKDLLKEENSAGKSPVDYLGKEIQVAIGKKLIKRTLNDNKVGLIHNRKTTKRRM